MKNDELDENSPVVKIEEIKQMIRTSRMDTRLRTPAVRRKRVGGWEKERQLWGNNIGWKEPRIELEEDRINLTELCGMKRDDITTNEN